MLESPTDTSPPHLGSGAGSTLSGETNPSSLPDDATSGSSERGSRVASSRTPGLERPLHNLPLQLSSSIGREREIAEIEALLADHRLLTLTGPGGSGKTRLALAVASELLEDFDHGARLVKLASLLDPDLVPQAVASVFGVREAPGTTLIESLTDELGSSKTLLVLDNCEHLVEAECSLDCGAYYECSTPENINRLSEGRHVFLVRALDGEGNADPSPAEWVWSVDRNK